MLKNLTSLEKRLLKGGGWAFTGKALSGVAGLATTALLARLLPPAELGSYLLALSIVFTVATLARFGFELGTLRHIAELMAMGQERAAKRLIGMSVATVAVLSILVSILLWVSLASWLSTGLFQSENLAHVAGLAAAWMAALAVLTLLAEIFRGFHDIRMAVFCSGTLYGGLITVVVQTGSFLVLLLGPGSTSLHTAITISLISTLINLAVAFAALSRRWASMGNAGDDSIPLQQLVRTSLPLWVSSLGILLMSNTDLWIVGAARPEDEVAVYGAASRLIKLLIVAQIVVNEVVAPLMAEFNIRGERAKLEKTLRLTATAAAAVSLPILIAFTFFGSEVLALGFGEFYSEGHAILATLSLGWLLALFGGATSYVLAMTGHGRLLMHISVITAVLTIATALAVVPRYGALGVAVAFASGQTLQHLLVIAGTRWKVGVWTCIAPQLAFTELARRFFGRNTVPNVTP